MVGGKEDSYAKTRHAVSFGKGNDRSGMGGWIGYQ
jgi:hypothetical protein